VDSVEYFAKDGGIQMAAGYARKIDRAYGVK